ncbi:S41 family peptidase [Tellurirhabdus bombi]|uniref:S41 family peptidase n=1 Tax=Tellurirhabdus bombi TaxID=2907205 RepID=UPI001F189835|nr:S41 family peptidase [Tellurirhabdus bombi]
MNLRLALIFVFFTGISQAQTSSYLADLKALKTVLQKTPSYKDQIKGDKLMAYDNLYEQLRADSLNPPTSYHYFYNLSQLLFPLRDNHLAIYQVPDYKIFKTKEGIEKFVASQEFAEYPVWHTNLDSLKAVLAQKPAESVEGIYYYDKFYTVGLFKHTDKEYIGVVLESAINLWQKGQIAIHLYEQGPNLFKAIYGHPLTKKFFLYSTEKYKNYTLVNALFYGSYNSTAYSKHLGQVDFVNLPPATPKFQSKWLNKDIFYIRVGSFQLNQSTRQKSKAFYDTIQNKLTTPNLILDIRNNEGGAESATRSYRKLLKKYARKGNIYVLINNGTLSQAEIFLLKLKKWKSSTVVGQTTKGMLTYGSNYGKREKLPSGNLEVYPTDMQGTKKLLQYEDYGIEPDITLTNTTDWIDQVVEIIQKKSGTPVLTHITN